MMTLNEASKWRIDLTREIVEQYYTHLDILLVVLGGSPTKNMSDSYSDLDIIVYWKEMDKDWIEGIPFSDPKAKRNFILRRGSTETLLESYYLDTLKVDFGHVSMKFWQEMVDDVLVKTNPDLGLQKMFDGFLHAVPIIGESEYRKWHDKVSQYPVELAAKTIQRNLRFYTKGCLLHQGLERGDVLFYYDGLCQMLKSILIILSALNHQYVPFAEPRWVQSEIKDYSIKPDNVWERMKDILANQGEESMRKLDELIAEIFELIEIHEPTCDLTMVKSVHYEEVLACETRPSLSEE